MDDLLSPEVVHHLHVLGLTDADIARDRHLLSGSLGRICAVRWVGNSTEDLGEEA